MQCNDFDCETIQSAIYKICFSSLNWTKLRFGLQIRFGCVGRQSPLLTQAVRSGMEHCWFNHDPRSHQTKFPHTVFILIPGVQGAGAGWRSATSQLLREVCPLYSVLSPLPGQISRCHTSVITVDMTQDTSASILCSSITTKHTSKELSLSMYQCIN